MVRYKHHGNCFLHNKQQTVAITSSSLSLGEISYRTVDRFVQEDAMRISFSNTEKAGLNLATTNNQAYDLSSKTTADSALVFSLKRESSVKGQISIGMACTQNNCSSEQNISELIKQLPKNEWHDLAIDLQCFITQGVNLEKISQIFSLNAQQVNTEISFSLSNIRIEENVDTAYHKQCLHD